VLELNLHLVAVIVTNDKVTTSGWTLQQSVNRFSCSQVAPPDCLHLLFRFSLNFVSSLVCYRQHSAQCISPVCQ